MNMNMIIANIITLIFIVNSIQIFYKKNTEFETVFRVYFIDIEMIQLINHCFDVNTFILYITIYNKCITVENYLMT